jgi:POT family proton-dependent oligopeptide transporter
LWPSFQFLSFIVVAKMNASSELENLEVAKAYDAKVHGAPLTTTKSSIDTSSAEGGLPHPTEEELMTLRRVSGKIPWTAYTIALVEMCERFSYYGTTAVCMFIANPSERLASINRSTVVNFIQQPLPPGSTTGAGFDGQSGALDMGQRASTGLTTFNAFWSYIVRLLFF